MRQFSHRQIKKRNKMNTANEHFYLQEINRLIKRIVRLNAKIKAEIEGYQKQITDLKSEVEKLKKSEDHYFREWVKLRAEKTPEKTAI